MGLKNYMKVLYAEDEISLSIAVTEILKMENYEVDTVYDGQEAWEHLQDNHYDAVILDIMMPKMSGIEVVANMREHSIFTPVMLLTAKNQTDDRITGFSNGADDYLGKPFSMAELIARLNAMLRRTTQYKETMLSCGNISLNCETNELKSDKGSLRLSSKESALLALFLKNENTALSSEDIMNTLWEQHSDENMVTLYISYLKNKLRQIHGDRNIRQEGNHFLFVAE